MLNLRFFSVNAVIRNITVAKHGCFGVILRRENHLLVRNGSLNIIYPKSRKLLAVLRSPNQYNLLYRLEHGTPGATSADVKQNLASPAPPPPPPPPPHSSVNSLNDKETTIDVNVQSPLTQAPQGTNISENQEITEATSSLSELSLPPIPQIEDFVSPIGEQGLKSLGLGGFSPVGIVQEGLQFLHVTFNLPWWSCIILSTLTLKIFLMPFQIKGKRHMNEYMNKMPEFQKLQKKVNEAKMTGNCYEVAAAVQDFNDFAVKNKMMNTRMLFYMMLNAPIFISFFIALKRMAETPGLSDFQSGGLFWFTDLTVPDQYYLLPLFSGLTVYLLLKTNLTATSHPYMKRAVYVIPILVVLFMSRFPAAMLCFSVASNSFALGQNLLLNWNPVRKYFKIPLLIPAAPDKMKPAGKGVVSDVRNFLNDYKILKEVNDRERLNALKFEESSSAPLRRTFKYNPAQAQVLLQKKQNKQN